MALSGPFEDHVLNEMGQTALDPGLITGPHVDPYAHAHGVYMGYRLSQNPYSVFKNRLMNRRDDQALNLL